MPAVEDIEKLAAGSGFTLQRTHLLRPHYAKTLDIWAANRVRQLRPARYHQRRRVHRRQIVPARASAVRTRFATCRRSYRNCLELTRTMFQPLPAKNSSRSMSLA